MPKLLPALFFVLAALAGPAHPATDKAASGPAGMASPCAAQAAEKKLAGAAKSSFLKKCENDALAGGGAADCDAQAAQKKLAGAAKSSFVKKCVADAAAK